MESSVNIEVYPNPTADQLIIKNGFENGTYVIYDAIGRNVLNGELTSSNKIDVAVLSPGQYVLKINGGQTSFTKQ